MVYKKSHPLEVTSVEPFNQIFLISTSITAHIKSNTIFLKPEATNIPGFLFFQDALTEFLYEIQPCCLRFMNGTKRKNLSH